MLSCVIEQSLWELKHSFEALQRHTSKCCLVANKDKLTIEAMNEPQTLIFFLTIPKEACKVYNYQGKNQEACVYVDTYDLHHSVDLTSDYRMEIKFDEKRVKVGHTRQLNILENEQEQYEYQGREFTCSVDMTVFDLFKVIQILAHDKHDWLKFQFNKEQKLMTFEELDYDWCKWKCDNISSDLSTKIRLEWLKQGCSLKLGSNLNLKFGAEAPLNISYKFSDSGFSLSIFIAPMID